MFNKSLLKSDFDRAAKYYDKNAALQQEVAGKLSTIVEGIFPDNAILLDAGAGTGFFARGHYPNPISTTRVCLLEGEGTRVIQLDISLEMCRIASNYSPAINADMGSMPFADNTFDGVVSSLALQWIDDLESVFKEFSRTLKNNGKIIFSTFGNGTLKELNTVFSEIGYLNRITKFHDKNIIKKALQNAGFEDIKIEEESIQKFYPDAISLMKSVRAVGGSNKLKSRNKPLSKSGLREINELYDKIINDENQIPATWKVLYITARKL